MSPKARKSLSSPWVTCDKCQCYVAQKDASTHEINCPPVEPWTHPFIQNNILHSTLETYKPTELPKHISDEESNNYVFMAPSALQLCKIPLGDPVILEFENSTIVKFAWPTPVGNVTGVALTKCAIELGKLNGPVKVQKLVTEPYIAKKITVENVGKHSIPNVAALQVRLKSINDKKVFCIGNRITVPYYGKRIVYKIVDIKCEEDLSEKLKKLNISENCTEKRFYKTLYSTEWVFTDKSTEKEVKKRRKWNLDCIGGYSDIIAEAKDVLDIGLGVYGKTMNFNTSKGLLLYGPSGVGKSMIAEALISEVAAECITIGAFDMSNKNKETETALNNLLLEAREKAPCLILIEDIDTFCPKKRNSSAENERRILAALVAFFDSVQDSEEEVMVIATSSNPDAIDPSLRRPGRIDNEFEICVPTRKIRKEIIVKLMKKMPHELTDEDIEKISIDTHGFVGADLYGLCSQAAKHALKRKFTLSKTEVLNHEEIKVMKADFNYALTIVNPSAMREVLADVPNVRWSDIGGQKDLKLKLRQAVEWPLKHPEAFTRLGIVPPKGLLMFGPPGCSKTMIAKALATESKLNFLNIKGPELFSKWVGESEKAIRQLFRKARQVAPAIIFIDEIDALGGERSSSANGGGSNVQERILAQLLTELDGVTSLGNVTLVAATNRPDRIDKALLRPGRFDRIIYVSLPDAETRREIFDIKLQKMPIAKDIEVQDLVDLTEGYSGAEVQAICHEAAMKALEEDLNSTEITKEHFRAALAIVTPRTPPSLIEIYEKYMQKSCMF